MSWANKFYTSILTSRVAEYEAADTTEKSKIISSLTEELGKCAEEHGVPIPKQLAKVSLIT